MIGRLFAAGVVAFWVVMMATLARVELFPKSLDLQTVPAERVLQKIFANRDPARLTVYLANKPVGFCHVEIIPLTARDGAPTMATNQIGAYRMQCDLDMKLPVLGLESRVRFVGSSVFSPALDVQEFRFKTTMGDGHVDMKGDDRTGKVEVDMEMGDEVQHRQFEFGKMSGAGLSGMLNVPGLGDLGAAKTTAAGKSATRVYYGNLTIGELTQRAFLIDATLNDTLTAKIWVDDSGQVLQVETSAGITMRGDVTDGFVTHATKKPTESAP